MFAIFSLLICSTLVSFRFVSLNRYHAFSVRLNFSSKLICTKCNIMKLANNLLCCKQCRHEENWLQAIWKILLRWMPDSWAIDRQTNRKNELNISRIEQWAVLIWLRNVHTMWWNLCNTSHSIQNTDTRLEKAAVIFYSHRIVASFPHFLMCLIQNLCFWKPTQTNWSR